MNDHADQHIRDTRCIKLVLTDDTTLQVQPNRMTAALISIHPSIIQAVHGPRNAKNTTYLPQLHAHSVSVTHFFSELPTSAHRYVNYTG